MGISQGSQGKGAIFTEINITPLTDIFLVLLIIMMVIAPMFQNTNKSIVVPDIKAGQSVEDNKVTVEVTKEGEFFINGTQASQSDLVAQLKALADKEQEKQIIVRADKATHSSEVLKVFSAASEAGFEKLTIAGEPLSGSRQAELDTGTAQPELPQTSGGAAQ